MTLLSLSGLSAGGLPESQQFTTTMGEVVLAARVFRWKKTRRGGASSAKDGN
ncbi:hypothetical protein [Pseudomaricurvus sp. HS19]|uniref:hypothetical protein n=1 Tax=Pseudomaricurvus sp. HS19 TaxID=2692626 RepID=UPI00136DA24C|nr:hypothetical protein [Pseudomaricurvus sp. HS19]MYM62390.1 hypothetical protein [Pseudomaricurvus sp. HS19]